MIDINKIIYTFLFHLTTYLIVLVLGYGLMVLLFSLVKKGDKYGQHLDFKKAIYLIASAIIIYIIFFTSFSWTQHDLFITSIYDLANMEQAIWNTLRGDILRMTTYYPVETRLFFHAEPIFFLLAPLYALWQHPKMLLLLQSIILGLGALPVFLIAYEKLKNTLASLMISLSYLLLPALYQGNIFDFHPLVLAPTFILFAFYFLIKNKNGVSFIFFLLAMMCREEIAFMVFFFGLYIFFFHKKKWGLLLAFIGLSWALLALMFIIPAFNPTDQPLQYLKYARYGETPLEVAGYIITHPLSLFEGYGGLGKLNYIIFLLTPVGFLALLYPPLLATGIFSFATIFLSDANDLLLGKYQYSTSLVAPLILATIFGITWLVKRIKNVDSQRLIIFFTSTILFINVCLLFFHQWTPLSFSSALSIAYSPEKAKAAQEAIKLVPSNASVVASWRLGSHLAQRRNLFLIDTPYRVTADYVVITKYTEVACEEKPSQLRSCEATAEDYQKYVQEISSHPHYQPIFDQADIMVFKRIQPAKE